MMKMMKMKMKMIVIARECEKKRWKKKLFSLSVSILFD